MDTVPPRAAARSAWKALPEQVRRDALRRAESGEAAADPAVAAILAGMLSERATRPSWGRRTAVQLPYAAVLGFLLALQYFGVLSVDKALFGIGVVIVAVVLVRSAYAALTRLFRRRAGREDQTTNALPPATAELVNLRKVIAAAPVRVPQPLVVRGQPLVRDALLHLGLLTLTSLGTIGLLAAARFAHGDAHRLLDIHIFAGAGLAATWVSWGRHLRRLPLRITEDGLRFGFAPMVAWRDVLEVQLFGPAPADKNDGDDGDDGGIQPAMVWVLGDGREIQLEFRAVDTPPEEIVLAARAYKPDLLVR